MKTIVTILIGLFVTFCSQRQELLEQIKQSGELRVVTRNSLTTCYRVEDDLAGFEYTLARHFADELGVRLKMILVDTDSQAVEVLERTEADLVVGLGTIAPNNTSIHFGPVYQRVSQQIVYRRKRKRLENLRDLAGKLVEISSDYGYADMLRAFTDKNPDIVWRERPSLSTAELLLLVLRGKVDIAIASSNEISLLRQRYPELNTAFDIGNPRSLAWGILANADNSLYVPLLAFFEKMQKDKKLVDIIEHHYGHVSHFDYVETQRFLRRARRQLPKYMVHFKAAATNHNLDWRLLSAIGYQESHWNPKAVSPTGVQGIMMLTTNTAKQLGVVDRTDEKESIFGGARYFAGLKGRLPARIEDPDRTWFALAAYNIGLGHLEDARILTQRAGADPDRWRDVRKFLPLISQKEWYVKTRYGYARGHEPVQFVQNIRRYYDSLVWLDTMGNQ
uniref:Membrane-bound lytic murein transglycosylase F n=1 Tax=Candidatus Kentrum sp. FM TaxID=2126340 RepID=A0A450T0G6_9GAMM|nr:MAG: membrane-bound lytic murein transglycosylase F [Candidatus Kentron sp. FM]VFJ59953.1 MAG: membrane-bound lytic murein transglycosylase F [Candidatus Kentron sp. FM]VFK12442.1 MAG: membrane-bound lytic murein transglycosylase F [Candidatus Kentron sp. FM]